MNAAASSTLPCKGGIGCSLDIVCTRQADKSRERRRRCRRKRKWQGALGRCVLVDANL